jgi:hypothetical protein
MKIYARIKVSRISPGIPHGAITSPVVSRHVFTRLGRNSSENLYWLLELAYCCIVKPNSPRPKSSCTRLAEHLFLALGKTPHVVNSQGRFSPPRCHRNCTGTNGISGVRSVITMIRVIFFPDPQYYRPQRPPACHKSDSLIVVVGRQRSNKCIYHLRNKV